MNSKTAISFISLLFIAWISVTLHSETKTPASAVPEIYNESDSDRESLADNLSDVKASPSLRAAPSQPEANKVIAAEERSTAAPSAEVRDRSGLTHDEKIERLLQAQEGFMEKLATGTIEEIANEENYFVIQCAVNILRERGEVQYEFDIDPRTGELLNGFRLKDVPENHIGVSSSRGKYAISLVEFPELDAARQRIFDSRHDLGDPRPISESHLARLDDLMERALLSLGVSQPPEKEIK